MLGLSDVLHRIVRNSHTSAGAAERYWATRTDEKARHHWFEIDGERKKAPGGTSPFVKEHIDAFFDHIFPALQEFWKEQTSENLMIICPYLEAVSISSALFCAWCPC